MYYLRTESNCRSIAWAPSGEWEAALLLTFVEGVEGYQNHIGFAYPHGKRNNYFECKNTYFSPSERGTSEVSLCGETLLPAPALAWLMCPS